MQSTHSIKLVSNSGMFSIPNKLHLTVDNPGPVQIDAGALSPQEKLWVNNASRSGRIELVPLPGYVPPQLVVTKPTEVQPVKLTAEQLKSEAEQKRLRLTADAKVTLKATVPALQKHVEKSSDLLKLRSMRELESEAKKPRSKVLEALNVRIAQIEAAVVNLSGEALTEKDIFVTSRDLKNLPEVEDEEIDTVTIAYGSDD
jgi:hypothetical protein